MWMSPKKGALIEHPSARAGLSEHEFHHFQDLVRHVVTPRMAA